MPESFVRVWITGSTESDFLKKLRSASYKTQTGTFLQKRDIILLYRRDISTFVLIGAYNYNISPIHQIPTQIPHSLILAAVPRLMDTSRVLWFSDISQSDALLLYQSEWRDLRNLLTSNNPQMEAFIGRLEMRQAIYTLESNTALVYDAARSPFQVIRVKDKFTKINDVFDNWRERSANNPDEPPLSFVDDLLNAGLVREPARRELSSFHQQMMAEFRNKNLEIDAIDIDFASGVEGLNKIPGIIDRSVEQRMCLLEDPITKKQVMIYYAHQKGHKLADLVSSDLIYEHTDFRSVVFVQYKRLQSQKTVRLDKDDFDQLQDLLDTCSLQGCRNFSEDENAYLNSLDMRLQDCPVFYKLVDPHPEVGEARKSVEGAYVQACLVHQIMHETQGKSISSETIRGVNTVAFFELLRNAQIGSRGVAFDKIRGRIMQHMKGKLRNETPTVTRMLVEHDGSFVTYTSIESR